MKILIITQYFWPESFRINDLAVSLKTRGHEVSVLTGLPNYPSGRLFDGYNWFSSGKSMHNGVTVIRVPLLTRGQGKSWQLALNYLSFVFFSCLLGPFLCRGKYDVVFVYEPSPFTVGLPGALFRYLKKAPLLFWVQDLWPESIVATGALRSPFLISLVGRIVRFIYRRCDRVLIQSKRFEALAIKAGADAAKIVYYPNWAEDLYRPVARDEAWPEARELPAGFHIMFAGNLGAAQSFDTILAAAERLRGHPDIHWLILGDGRLASWVKSEIGRRGLADSVHMLGRHPVESMPRWFATADVMLVTLKRDPIFALTIPTKVQAYMACAKPIVAALDGEGARVIEEAGAGLTAPADDAEALARTVLNMYKMTDAERASMGKLAQRYFQTHFERRMLLDRLDEWMKELAQGNAPCAS